MDTFPDREGPDHMGILSDHLDADGLPLVINNWTDGTVTKEMDLLAFVPVLYRFRLPAAAAIRCEPHATLGAHGEHPCASRRGSFSRRTRRAHTHGRQLSPRSSIASDSRAPSELGGYRLRVTLSAVAVGGQLLDIDDPRTLHPMTGSSEIKAPFAFGHYAQLGADTAIVLVVEASAPYGDVLPIIADSLGTDLLGGIEHAQIAVMPYGDSVANGKLGTLKAARGRVAGLASDGSSDEPAMLDAVERALMLLRKAKLDSGKPLRKIVVVIGDGRDRSGDRDRVTKLGKKAGTDGVRIHTIGFSPTDQRRPLLALGELSKRSLGTFRVGCAARAPTRGAPRSSSSATRSPRRSC